MLGHALDSNEIRKSGDHAKYRPDIDGIRAIAVIAVVAYHTGIPGFGGGFTGVDIFFVISGFLITGLLCSDIETCQRIRITQFYARRIRRILPTLLLVVLTTVFVSVLFLSAPLGELKRVLHSAAATLTVSANLYFFRIADDYFTTRSIYQPLLHTWSLSVEEQFYFFWPAALAAAFKVFSDAKYPRRWLTVVLALIVILSFLCAVAIADRNNTLAFYLPATRAWELGSGGLLAVIIPSVRGVSRRAALIASMLGLVLIVTGIAAASPNRFEPLFMAVFPVFGTILLILGNAIYPVSAIGRLLSIRVLVQVGLVSYAWYLWHWPALSIARIISVGRPDLLRDCTISALTLALSFVTLWYFERPFRYRISRNRSSRYVVVAGVGATIGALAIISGVDVWSRHLPQNDSAMLILRAKEDMPVKHCLVALGSNETSAPEDCLATDKSKRIIIWGDSIADRFSPALHRWVSDHREAVAIEQLTKPGCPPLLDVLPTATDGASAYTGCRSFNLWAAGRLPLAGMAGESGVLMSAAWWPRATDFDLGQLGAAYHTRLFFDVSARTTEESLKVLETAMRSTLSEIARRGLRVVIVLQTPILLSPWGGGALDAPDCLYRKSNDECSMPLSLHYDLSNPINQVLRRVSGEFSNVRVFDPIPSLCEKGKCSARVNGIIAYTDYEHLSATMSESLADVLGPYLDWLTDRDESRPR